MSFFWPVSGSLDSQSAGILCPRAASGSRLQTSDPTTWSWECRSLPQKTAHRMLEYAEDVNSTHANEQDGIWLSAASQKSTRILTRDATTWRRDGLI